MWEIPTGRCQLLICEPDEGEGFVMAVRWKCENGDLDYDESLLTFPDPGALLRDLAERWDVEELLKDKEEARDVAQETLIAAARGGGRPPEVGEAHRRRGYAGIGGR